MKPKPQPHFDQILNHDHELIQLRQSYGRVGKKAVVKTSRYAYAKQYKRICKQLRKLQAYVGQLIRDIQRTADRVRQQQRKDSHQFYSPHEPEVQCISKGKVYKRYEFGQKVAIATFNGDNWVVVSRLMKNSPYDGHTLATMLAVVESITGVAITDAYVDRGYRGHDYTGCAEVHVAGQRYKGPSRTERRRRSADEPKIGHLKRDHRMDRCFLAGLRGDAINAVLAAAGTNMRKLLRRFFYALIRWLEGAVVPSSAITASWTVRD